MSGDKVNILMIRTYQIILLTAFPDDNNNFANTICYAPVSNYSHILFIADNICNKLGSLQAVTFSGKCL
jgi:hypothetical protein